MATILENRKQTLPGLFRSIFGDLPFPGLVHRSDGGRQSAAADAYTTAHDLQFMGEAHCETRLLLTLLASVASHAAPGNASHAASVRRYSAAALLRDLLNAMLEQVAQVDAADPLLKMEALVLRDEAFPMQGVHIAELGSSRTLPGLPAWGELKEWWDEVVSGQIELECVVVQSPAR